MLNKKCKLMILISLTEKKKKKELFGFYFCIHIFWQVEISFLYSNLFIFLYVISFIIFH